jgi:chromosome segregation ATPase
MAVILLAAFVALLAVRVPAQEPSSAADRLENLRSQLSDVQDNEAELKIRLEQLDFDLKPENIERHFNGYGSTRPEELRESRRRQLQTEKDRRIAQLEQLASSRGRLETAITSTEAEIYQQSALGAAGLNRGQNRNSSLLSLARTLLGIAVLFVVVGGLVFRVVIRQRRHI